MQDLTPVSLGLKTNPLAERRISLRRDDLAQVMFSMVFVAFALWLLIALGVWIFAIATGDATTRHPHGTPVLWAALAVVGCTSCLSLLVAKRYWHRRAALGTKTVVLLLAIGILVEIAGWGPDLLMVTAPAILVVLAVGSTVLEVFRPSR
jgi:hypothetical protein